jgi:hypothetical protein
MRGRSIQSRLTPSFGAETVFAAIIGLLANLASAPARADIYQWEWVDPSDDSLGKQQSQTLTPGGAGAITNPYVAWGSLNLTKAYLIGADLHTPILDIRILPMPT